METLAQDIRFGLRMLHHNPGFTVVALLVLAVGIGANTAIFSVVDGVLLHALPYPDSERLVVIRAVQPLIGQSPISYPQFLAWREQKDVFDEVATFTTGSVAFTGSGDAEELTVLSVSHNLLPLMGVSPVLGRGFTADEEARSAKPVVLLTHSFWRDRFHSDRSVLGQKLTLNDRVLTIIGVLPPEFIFTKPQVVAPLRLDTQIAPPGLNFLTVWGKLRPGINFAQGKTAVEQVALPRVKKIESHTEVVTIVRLQDFVIGDSRPLLLILLGSVALVLLIACANIANLLLARGAAREKEIAIRISLGAGRMRLVRQILTESTLLALMGGALGIGIALVSVAMMKSLLVDRLPRSSEIHISAEVLLLTAALSLFTGLIFGLAPSLQAVQGNLQERLKQGGWHSAPSFGTQRLRSALVVAEITLSLVLLAAAGLLLRSFMRLLNSDRGFATDHVLTMQISPSPVRYKDPRTEINYLQQIIDRVQGLPGVRAAGFITDLPLRGGSTNGGFNIEGRQYDPGHPFHTIKEFVDGRYFAAMRIPLRTGRYFDERDTSDSPKVVMVNETFARAFYPGENPIGKHIDVTWGDPAWSEIIGVVADSRQDTLASPIEPSFYALVRQKPELMKFLGFTLVVRTDLDPKSVLRSITDQVHQLDKNQALARVRTMDTVVEESVAPRRIPMVLMVVFAAIALFLAAIGIYGVLSYFVLQRRQEIGVRMAIGAQRSDVLRLVLSQGAKLIVTGIAIGLLGAFLVSRAMVSLLFDIKPTDVPTFIGVSLIFALLALLACAVPAFRATQMNPLAVLRNE
jgi:predicted permease